MCTLTHALAHRAEDDMVSQESSKTSEHPNIPSNHVSHPSLAFRLATSEQSTSILVNICVFNFSSSDGEDVFVSSHLKIILLGA